MLQYRRGISCLSKHLSDIKRSQLLASAVNLLCLPSSVTASCCYPLMILVLMLLLLIIYRLLCGVSIEWRLLTVVCCTSSRNLLPSSCLWPLRCWQHVASTSTSYRSTRRHYKSITVCFSPNSRHASYPTKTFRVKYERRTWNMRSVVEALTAVLLQVYFWPCHGSGG